MEQRTKGLMVIWVCECCGATHRTEHATNRRFLRCWECLNEYAVVGHHVNGLPILRLIAHGREQ